MTGQIFIVSERDILAGRFQNIGAYELFEHAVNHVQSRVVAWCDANDWAWIDGDSNRHEIALPDFMRATSTVLRGTTRRGVDNLIIEAGTRSWEYRIDGLLVTYTIDMMEVK